MPYQLKPRNTGLTDEQVLAELRRVVQALGKKTVTTAEYDRRGRISRYVLHRHFGSWNRALAAAGLEVTHRWRIQPPELFENLERVWQSLGRQPACSDMARPLSVFSTGPYVARFGGWRAALEAFVLWANRRGAAPPPPSAAPEPLRPRTAGLALRFAVFKRDHFRCTLCGRSPATDTTVELQLDHKVPWSQGGGATMENLATLCRSCNRGKSNGPLP